MKNEAQTNVQNYFIPASVDTVSKLHKSCLELIKTIKEKQDEVQQQTKFIETTIFTGLIPRSITEREENVNDIQMLLSSYRKVLVEINKQSDLI